MKVLVTGHKGYVGAQLVPLLMERGHEVTGCDVHLFEGCPWESLTLPHHEWERDFRLLREEDLRFFDAVIHLAAISNDPMGELDPDITRQVNGRGSVDLAAKAKSAGVCRFLFASSCSMYGGAGAVPLDEKAPLNPLSVYAESKVWAEQNIHDLAEPAFSPTSLRCATAYGYSPHLRIDLVVNHLLACAVAMGEIRIMSDGTPWRPLIHVHDIARAFTAFLEAPREQVHNRAVNVGGDEANYQVKEVAEEVQRLIPNAKVVFTGEVGHDPRNYRVSFRQLGELLPNFRLAYTLHRGMGELLDKYREHGFTRADFEGDRFVRLRTLKRRMALLNQEITHAF